MKQRANEIFGVKQGLIAQLFQTCYNKKRNPCRMLWLAWQGLKKNALTNEARWLFCCKMNHSILAPLGQID